ncbi:tripartite motif-containing protein 3-like [Mytilus edulis]|uniref:tripartite motif-containing protein 3-like n=1 Tax=Mytilus edulis TaxID=6550 RepID=UPI0039EF1905
MLKATKGHIAISAKQLARDETMSFISDSHSGVVETRTHVVSHVQQLVQAQVQVEKGQYSGTFKHEFMCSAPGDKEVTRVRGIAILSDGRIVVADYKNRSLKLFNSELRFETVKYIKEDPRGMATSANDFVVVTIADKKEIRIYKFEKNKIRTHKTIKVVDKPYSIACDKDHFAVELGEGDDGTIRIYDQNIREMCVIPGNTRSFGQFTGNTLRLALDYTKQVIFVADVVKESVHCVDFHGGLIWTVNVRSPRGIVFHNSILFVASNDAHRINQMNAIDGLVYALLDEDNRIKRPRYIAYNANLRKLAVEIDSNHIKLYSITK